MSVKRMKEAMEDQETLRSRITLNPRVLAGKPTIRGLRLSVEQILAELAAGVPEQEILEEYPGLEPEDIRAVLLYAKELVAIERVYPVGQPA
jgi:uncharacterized protein (DUF433 family)